MYLIASFTSFIYTLSLHDALPILGRQGVVALAVVDDHQVAVTLEPTGVDHPSRGDRPHRDRKSTRLNSSHRCISYAVFCLKKKKNNLLNNLNKANKY